MEFEAISVRVVKKLPQNIAVEKEQVLHFPYLAVILFIYSCG